MCHINSKTGTKSLNLPVKPRSGDDVGCGVASGAEMSEAGASVTTVGVGAGTGVGVLDAGASVSSVGVGVGAGASVANTGASVSTPAGTDASVADAIGSQVSRAWCVISNCASESVTSNALPLPQSHAR